MKNKKNGILFETIVGSHIWNMNHENSDTDVIIGFIIPTKRILRGYHTYRPKQIQDRILKKDYVIFEVEHIINQLIKGNLNFLVATMSPIVLKTSKYHRKLKKIVEDNIAKNCFHSIFGMAKHNYRKFIMRLRDRVAIVTAAAGAGIGQATARALAREGALTVVSDIHANRPFTVADDIKASFGVETWAYSAMSPTEVWSRIWSVRPSSALVKLTS